MDRKILKNFLPMKTASKLKITMIWQYPALDIYPIKPSAVFPNLVRLSLNPNKIPSDP
jgi:hypothetical protein